MSNFRAWRIKQTMAWVVTCTALSATFTPSAHAAPDKDELSKARARFQQATELEQAGNWAAASQLFREVGQVRMTPQVRYHIALCEEKLGKLVAALGGFELALSEAESIGPDFQREVEEKTKALRERIPKILIDRGDGAAAAMIELDGVALGASSIGIEVPLDPGPHQINARASGYEVYAETVEIPEKETKRVVVTLNKLSSDSGAGGGRDNPPALPPAPVQHSSRVVPYAIGIGGGVLLVSSGVFYLMRQSQINTLNTLCGGPGVCNPTQSNVDEVNNHKGKLNTYDALMKITAIGGVAAVGVAIGLIVLEPKPQKPATAGLFINPAAPGADVGGFSLAGAF